MTDGLSGSGFDIDLRNGQAREDALVHVLLKSRVEHKADNKCKGTGNLFVEYRQKGRPSGIGLKPGADRWAFEYDAESWLIVPRERLRERCALAYELGLTARGGDHNNYEGVLLPIEWLVVTPQRLDALASKVRVRSAA